MRFWAKFKCSSFDLELDLSADGKDIQPVCGRGIQLRPNGRNPCVVSEHDVVQLNVGLVVDTTSNAGDRIAIVTHVPT